MTRPSYMLFLKLIGESVSFAFSALRENQTRTFLSLLGVTIGITTIISVFSAVDTLRANLESSVEKLGSNTLYIQKWPWGGGGEYPWWRYANRPEPTLRDYEALRSNLSTTNDIAFNIGIPDQTIKYLNNDISGVVVSASTHEIYAIRDLNIEHGRYFSEGESNRGGAVVILGNTVADGLFAGADPIGKSVTLLGRRLTVIGVLEREGEGMLIDASLDNAVMIPFTLARNLVNIRNQNPSIMVKAPSGMDLREAETEIRMAMRSIRRLSPQEEDDFSINKTTIISAQLDVMFQILNLAGVFIGGFSILVGGFGIANIMFVSVKERTPIIGIQKALGAKNYFILAQFLIEAVALCLIGGLIGLGLVYGIAAILRFGMDVSVVVSVKMVIITVILSTLIGLVSGIIPAVKASRLNPVDAIRSV